MFSIFKPFLFSLDPEAAHNLAIKSLKFNPLPKKVFEVEDEQMLNIKLLRREARLNCVDLQIMMQTFTQDLDLPLSGI